ncbi:MAG: tRNA (5-methylaminomethyl-2-thiouridine)(34)-methyltransferase MnmD [Bacteroidota bacterium]
MDQQSSKVARVNHTLSKDGSSTLWAPDFDEHYHSVHGALTESLHVFIEAGLRHVEAGATPLHIFEMGFGTGLNALLTLAHREARPIYYTSLELYPLQEAQWSSLNYGEATGHPKASVWLQELHEAKWGEYVEIEEGFFLRKQEVDLLSYEGEQEIDVVYFDAFAPSSQPELWTPEVMKKIFDLCRAGAIFTTYSAKGDVRRALLAAGFDVAKIPGPPGKREMLRATKPF